MCARVAQEPGRSRLLHRRRRGAGAAQEMVRVLGECVRPWGSEGRRKRWYRRAKETMRGGRGGEKSESVDSTEEAGEPTLKGPGGGKGPTGWWSLRRDRWRGHWAGRSSQRDKARERSWARREPKMVLTTLAHPIYAVWMGEAYRRVWTG